MSSNEREKQGRKYSLLNIIFRPLAIFLYTYFYKCTFFFGVRGLIIAVYRASFIFWTYAKMWEKEVQAGKRI